jgi:hypothetical protein
MTPFIPVIAVAIVGLLLVLIREIKRANRSLPFNPPGPEAFFDHDGRAHDFIPERRA